VNKNKKQHKKTKNTKHSCEDSKLMTIIMTTSTFTNGPNANL